ncbi:Heavy metal transport/detoxification superfamily protein [Striga hermonthica]|uniref:Heavy metal transport/detoxification superfamily protein n=1 Tax=Striga hermonthica TaxID=68872 RepID=A0A9N7MVS5_STRHE|nr:Heavy metal transport/detoxification superfamily protein [Striga hermonthica]
MQQKIVIKVFMHCPKCRTKAMQIAVTMQGVESAELTGEEKDHVVVVGVGIDSVELTRQLRKKVAYAELVSVGENKKKTEKPDTICPSVIGFPPPPPPPPPPYYSYHVCEERDPFCIIL